MGLTGALEAFFGMRPSPRCWPAYEPMSTAAKPGVVVRVGEDVGSPATGGHPGGQVHRGAPDTTQRLAGVRRQKSVRTTIADPAAERAPDLVDRQFRVPTNALLVADFTYVKLVTGMFVYVAFVIDAYAGAVIGWEAAGVKAHLIRGVSDPSSRCIARPAGPSPASTAPFTTQTPEAVHCNTFR